MDSYLSLTPMNPSTFSRRKFVRGATFSVIGFPYVSLLTSAACAAEDEARKLGFALVGLGGLSTGQLAPALQKTKYCRLAAIVTGTPSKIPVWKDRYQIADKNVYNYDTMEKMADNPDIERALLIPYLKNVMLPLGTVLYITLVTFVIAGFSNAVNLTDGLDGLAIMPAVLVSAALGVFAYAAGNVIYSNYLGIPYVVGSGELLVFCAALAGAGLGFLWFNTYPAQVFMGDIGALALGAALGLVAVAVRQELVLFIMGGVFVVETVSVIIQVASYKTTGRRIFRMAPLHHHFELKGWAEPKVIVRFWIITVILVLIGLASLKIR